MVRATTISKDFIVTAALKSLLLVVVFYNFHRYLFKYGSSDFVDASSEGAYTSTPLVWQVGKYLIVALILGSLYLFGEYKLRLNSKLFFFYLLLGYVLILVLTSGFYYQKIIHNSLGRTNNQLLNFDELEYIVFSVILFPLVFFSNEKLEVVKTNIDAIIKFVTLILIVSNLWVIANYFIFDVLPFHGYKGSLLIRFGGFWDDPNCFSILCSFLIFYAIHKGRYITSLFLFVCILLAISFTGYVLLFGIMFYFMLRNRKAFLAGSLISLLFLLVGYLNMDIIETIYELKKGSLDSHANQLYEFTFFPLQQPMLFHETWLLSFMLNYAPISYVAILIAAIAFVKAYFWDKFTVQKGFFIVFFVSSLFLPFLYMFPLNFIGIFFFILYCKKVTF